MKLKLFLYTISVVFSFVFQINISAQGVATNNDLIDVLTDTLNKKTERNSDVLIINESDLDNESDEQIQNVSGLLNSGSDPFASATRFNLSLFWFRPRGYDGQYNHVYINGVLFNETEGGRFTFPLIGGLNDATRNQETATGLELSGYGIGSLGGVSNINMLASQYSRGCKMNIAAGNTSYNGRLQATLSTGLMKNGWAFSLSGSARTSVEGINSVKGTYYEGWSLAFAAEKRINTKHTLAFNALYAPIERGMQGAGTLEAYNLTGSNYYNPNWGYQNGEIRSARVSTYQAPIAIIKHEWKINNKMKIHSGMGLKYLNWGVTALNWYNSADPRPDYYRYYPSYYSENPTSSSYNLATADLLTTAWQNDINRQQIDWNSMYQINYLANMSSLSARYIVEERHNDQLAAILNVTTNYKFNKNLSVDGGLHASMTKGLHYKKLNDLLGSDYWLDVDQFAERDFAGNSSILQNDINNPNQKIGVGDVFGYNYNMYVNKENAWFNGKLALKKLDVNVAGSITGTQFFREGLMKNGRAPENSYGKGDMHTFIDFSAKTNITYKLTGRHVFMLNALYQTNAPLARNAYISPRIKDDVISNLKSEKIISYDLNYYLRLPKFNSRLTVFRTDFTDQSELNSYYSDFYKTFVNAALIGISKTHQGIEFGFDSKITNVIGLYGAASVGQYMYTNRPTQITSYENGAQNDSSQLVFLKNFFVNGTPQTVGTIGIKLSLRKNWFFDVNTGYGSRSYIDLYNERRTSQAITFDMTDKQISDLTKQEELKGGMTLNASLGKSWRVKRKYFINANIMVNNILDNKNIQTSGYEQSRLNVETHIPFPNKYYYGLGRTFMAIVGLRF